MGLSCGRTSHSLPVGMEELRGEKLACALQRLHGETPAEPRGQRRERLQRWVQGGCTAFPSLQHPGRIWPGHGGVVRVRWSEGWVLHRSCHDLRDLDALVVPHLSLRNCFLTGIVFLLPAQALGSGRIPVSAGHVTLNLKKKKEIFVGFLCPSCALLHLGGKPGAISPLLREDNLLKTNMCIFSLSLKTKTLDRLVSGLGIFSRVVFLNSNKFCV